MNVRRITEPASEPVTIAEAKAHLRVINSDEDAYITGLITAARRAVEDMTSRSLINTEFEQALRSWNPWIDLLRAPVGSVDSVKYDAEDGTEQTVDAAEYELRPHGGDASELVFLDAFDEPALLEEPRIDRIRIRYTAGYGASAGLVPEPLRHAVLFLLTHLFENRSPVGINVNVTRLPFAVDALVGPYIIYSL